MLCMQVIFLDGWVEVGHFEWLIFPILKHKKSLNFQSFQQKYFSVEGK